VFVLNVIRLAKDIPRDEVGRVFVNQLLRSATSIGANYEEASEAQTGKDLIYKLSVVK
jgi:four helix bundle protein